MIDIDDIIDEILGNLKECIEFNIHHSFKTINLFVVAMFETQLRLNDLFENDDSLREKVYNDLKECLYDWKTSDLIYDYRISNNKRGFVIVPFEDTDMKGYENHYTLNILRHYDLEIA